MTLVGGEFVYLKLQQHKGTSTTEDIIPLKVQSVSVSVDKTIPNLPVPLSGLATGESATIALDLGMSNKRISLSGVILETSLTRSHTSGALTFTAHEVAQLIASGVDSTGAARYQAINELVILIDSKVNESYVDRGKAADASETSNGTLTAQIPLTFRSRGASLEKDNKFVVLAKDFPTSNTSTGLTGFIQSFSFELNAETVEVAFNMEFVVANVLP